MSRKCALTGRKIQTGHNVSNSNAHTKRIFAPNLQVATLKSDLLNRSFKVKVAVRTLRTITKYGSLNMTEFGAKLKHQLMQIPEVKERMKTEAEEKKAKRVIKPSARSLLKKKNEKKAS